MDPRDASGHHSSLRHSAALPLIASLVVAVSVWGAGAFGLSADSDTTGPSWNLAESRMPRDTGRTEQELVQLAIAEHSAAFPLGPSPGVPAESEDSVIQRAMAEHGALLDGLLAGF